MPLTYSQAIDFLINKLPMYQRVGAPAMKPDLNNITALCEKLGNPHLDYPKIHVAGTNGKGSVSHLLSAVLQKAGYKVGLHTSPHYLDFKERMKVNGLNAPEQFVTDFVNANLEFIEGVQPSFFEISVAMAFQFFAQEKVDAAIIEVGLGGRLDSTNIIRPVLSIITNISYDHQYFLGNTLQSIAAEKAGIIKENVPVIIGEEQPEITLVFENMAAKQKAPLSFASRNLRAEVLSSARENLTINVFENGKLKYENLKAGLAANYQLKNMITALMAIEKLKPHFNIDNEAIYQGFSNVRQLTGMLGRWQIISEKPLIICDGAHNQGGIEAVTEQLKLLSFRTLHIVFGCVNDKDLSAMFALMPREARYYFAKPNIPRGLDAEILKMQAREFEMHGRAYQSVNEAFLTANTTMHSEDVLFVGGSIFVVAEALA